MNRNTDREAAIRWAQERLADYRTIIMDTETTGLSEEAEIVQIAMIDLQCNTLMNTLVKPTISIPRDAERIHGISNDQVASAPTFDLVYRDLYRIVEGRTLLIYNADYDMRLIFQSLAPYGLTGTELITSFREVQCAMAWYSQWIGDWSEWFGNYKWQKLPSGDHSALGDCIATLKVLHKMAGMKWQEPQGSLNESTANR